MVATKCARFLFGTCTQHLEVILVWTEICVLNPP